MPNFAADFPCLLFLPFFIFAAVVVIAGIVHLAILLQATIRAARTAPGTATQTAGGRDMIGAIAQRNFPPAGSSVDAPAPGFVGHPALAAAYAEFRNGAERKRRHGLRIAVVDSVQKLDAGLQSITNS